MIIMNLCALQQKEISTLYSRHMFKSDACLTFFSVNDFQTVMQPGVSIVP
jgi:hypothetical protein